MAILSTLLRIISMVPLSISFLVASESQAAPAHHAVLQGKNELSSKSMNESRDTSSQSIQQSAANLVLMSFIGDALALGPHWIYDQDVLQGQLNQLRNYQAPLTDYHPGKSSGDFTHYGDQTLLLLRSLATEGCFDLDSFATTWRAFWEDPQNESYRDGATTQTLEHLQSGLPPQRAGSDSHDIAGAARIGPLFLLSWESDEALLEAARRETSFTHRNPEVVESAEFFARLVLAVRGGADIPAALESTMKAKDWSALPATWFSAAQRSASSSATDSEALKEHGLTCHTEDAFPGICHLLLRYPDDPTRALIENASAGGDNAARGLLLGLVYGAKFPLSELPAEWLDQLNAREEIRSLIEDTRGKSNRCAAD